MTPSQVSGPWVRSWLGVGLRLLKQPDIPLLYSIAVRGSLGGRFRFRGATPSPATFQESISESVLAQFVVERVRDRKAVGVVVAYNASVRDGRCYLSIGLADPSLETQVEMGKAGYLFVDYLFQHWPLRKIYLELSEEQLPSLQCGMSRWFTVEGCLNDHHFFNGRYWAQMTLVLAREDWQRVQVERSTRMTPLQLSDRILALAEFCALVAKELPEPQELADVDMYEKLDFDSLRVVEMLVTVDEMVGGTELEWPEVRTLRDVYLHYCAMMSAPILDGGRFSEQL